MVDIINKNDGIITSKEAQEKGISRTMLKKVNDLGLIERISQGVYITDKFIYDEYYLFQLKHKNTVFSYNTALYLQEKTEELAFKAGGSDYKAPVIKTGDFLNRKCTDSFGKVLPTYPIGTRFAEPENYLPEFITDSLREGIVEIGKKMKGFDSYDSILTGVESRSTSPVRIERDEKRQALTLKGFYPCGEGAGYAGGIMSAAVDGMKCAECIAMENQ